MPPVRQSPFSNSTHIAIVGLGQIGGSIVRSLRKRNFPGSITGIDVSKKRLRLMSPFIDHSSKHWNQTKGADLTILCLHYDGICKFLDQASSESTIMDVCSAKAQLLKYAAHKKLHFIGGHPLAGNEFRGEKGWNENLFEGSNFFLCQSASSNRWDLNKAQEFARAIGACPVIVDPVVHDHSLAVASHVPAFLSILLKESTRNISKQFHGPGYNSMIRLSNTPPALLETFLSSNRFEILKAARKFQRELNRWISKIESF